MELSIRAAHAAESISRLDNYLVSVSRDAARDRMRQWILLLPHLVAIASLGHKKYASDVIRDWQVDIRSYASHFGNDVAQDAIDKLALVEAAL